MANETNKDKKVKLVDEFDKIQSQHKDLTTDINQYLVDPDSDLPEFGALEQYDYDEVINDALVQADHIIESLADLYLGDSDIVKNHPYVLYKKIEDKEDYAASRFNSKMGKKLMLQMFKQIDNGDNGVRMYEAATKMLSEMREDSKSVRSSRNDIEKFYKELRADMGLNDMSDKKAEVDDTSDDNTENTNDMSSMNSTEFNKIIDDMIKSKKENNENDRG